MTDSVVIFVTTGSKSEAEKIAATLVEENLIACGNILDSVASVFRWKGELCRETEVLLLLKTVRARFEQVSSRVQELHSYDVPEIIALPIVAGAENYLSWLASETSGD